MLQEITDEMRVTVEQAHKRKLLTGQNVAYEQTLVEVALLAAYGREPDINDFKRVGKRLDLLPLDSEGRRIRVIIPRFWPVRVYSYLLDDDIVVVAETNRRVRFFGWLPMQQVEDAPVFWFERDGKRAGYSHEIDNSFLIKMPETFDFVDTCKHGDEWPALWDYSNSGWFCFGCERVIYADDDRRRIRAEDRKFGYGDSVSENEKGV